MKDFSNKAIYVPAINRPATAKNCRDIAAIEKMARYLLNFHVLWMES